MRYRAVAAMLAVSSSIMAVASAPAHAQTSGAATLWGTQGAGCEAPAGEAQPWRNPAHSPECRARFVLQQFRNLEEKLLFLSPPPAGLTDEEIAQRTVVRDVAAELGLPKIGGSDGPAGLARGATATALPSPIAIAASFDTGIARQYGGVLAREFRAAGLGNILGPAFDIARSWKFGRLSESFGEDPFLTAAMSGAEVRALSDGGVITTMKHYAVYTQEAGRVGDQPSGSAPTGNNIVSERAMREIYLPGFQAAVQQGGAGGVMCSFPRINGTYACENPHLFDILKREWGFDGTVSPDFPSAQRSITRAVMAGLDSGFFTPVPFNAALAKEKPLAEAARAGDIPEARIDDMILRRLIPQFRIGLIDNPPATPGGKALANVSTPANRAIAADIVAAGTVLLKNDEGILPFGRDVRSVAVIGLQATDKATVVEQGSPYVRPAHLQPALPAIRERAGRGVRVTHAQGTLGLAPLPPVDAKQFAAPGGGAGFRAEYAANRLLNFSAAPLATAVVADPSLATSPDIAGLPGGNGWSVRYTSRFTPAESGVHRFTLHGSGTARLLIDGQERGGFELADFGNAAFANVALQAGQAVDIQIEYTPRSALRTERQEMFGMEMGLTLRFGHAGPDQLIAEAAEAARKADVAVVFAGELVGEGMDRHNLALQGDQDRLIEAVAAANPRTVVVLSTGGPVAMPWLGRVQGVMETWLPGDAFGPAIAGMLFGDREPGGRLPVTFPADETQGPATERRQYPGLYEPSGTLGDAYFEEGIFVGYRYWDQHGQVPLFPFGYGLGYGSAELAVADVSLTADGGISGTIQAHNAGSRATNAVVQVYLGLPAVAGSPPKELKAVVKLELEPGARSSAPFTVPADGLKYWDEKENTWRTAPGTYRVMVGRSSRDIIWEGTVEVPAE